MMSTSSFDSESLVRRHVCGLWASLWLGSADQPGVVGPLPAPRQMVGGRLVGCLVGCRLTNLGLSDRCRHRGGWLGGCLVGCCPKILGLSDRCRHRGGWFFQAASGRVGGPRQEAGWGIVWGVVVRRSWVIGPLPAPRQMVGGRVGCCPNNSGYRTAAGTVLGVDRRRAWRWTQRPRQMVRDRVGC